MSRHLPHLLLHEIFRQDFNIFAFQDEARSRVARSSASGKDGGETLPFPAHISILMSTIKMWLNYTTPGLPDIKKYLQNNTKYFIDNFLGLDVSNGNFLMLKILFALD